MNLNTTFATQAYASARPATAPTPGKAESPSQAAGKLAGDFAATLENTERVAMESMTGNADPHALVAALSQTELAVETAVTIRNKVVEAYQEILRMPI
ncbi:MAG: flagellar hook-basal body complex protein FliE [Alphaproteobacteria bacterium]|nr:MAG: flagellar hook-basal body complex protein FliE [Alphaproteobacteria bacterium]